MAAGDTYFVKTKREEALPGTAHEEEVNSEVHLSVGFVDKTEAMYPVVADEATAVSGEAYPAVVTP